MRIYNTAIEMYEETIRELFKRGQTVFDKTVQGKIVSEVDFEQKEIVNYSFTLNDFSDLDGMMALAKSNFMKDHLTSQIANAWFKDMISNKTLAEQWWQETEYTKDYFKKFCDEGAGQASYSYGERIIPKLAYVIERLKTNNYSRGAVINVYESPDVTRVGRRTPCTLSYHFMARDTLHGLKLNLIVHQRSCDMINFFPLDVYKSYLLLKYIADECKLKVGALVMNVDSLHIYKKDIPDKYTW